VGTYEDVLQAMRERDRIDSTRALAPLRAAPDAMIVDSTSMDVDQVVEHVWKLAMGEAPLR